MFENYPHAAISTHLGYRCLYATHQVVSTLYYVTLFQSVFNVYKYYCTSPTRKQETTTKNNAM